MRISDWSSDVCSSDLKPLVIHDNTTILRLVDLFRQSNQHQAVVVDEYGSVEGMVTSTDVLEAIAGDLPELGQEAEAQALRRDDGSWLIDGMMTLDDVQDATGLRKDRKSTRLNSSH